MNKFFQRFIPSVIAAVSFVGNTVADTYTINAGGVGKKITEGSFGMGTAVNPQGETLGVNNYYLKKNGKPWLPVMGEFHFSRCPRHMWEDEILKMKAGGIDIVSSYCFWIHHEEEKGVFDFSGQRDLRAFIELCKKHGLYFLLRSGPWCHGEARNGGFPDWVQALPGKRSNDPIYLSYVKRLYAKYFEQCKGLLYKDGGPIVGMQLENEFNGADHLMTLKRLAREAGFDVPFYTVTGWGNVQIPDHEVLPVQAGYADMPWFPGTHQLEPNFQYLFMPGIPINAGVGTDVLPVQEVHGGRSYNPSDYPWLTAELGLGVCPTVYRRPLVTVQDALSLMIAKLAGGANCLGYYMYHGGTNPQGKLTRLNEPNLPTMSYDFQCAVGEYGETYGKFREMKLLHYFLQDFGEQVCRTIPAMPDRRPRNVRDIDTLRCMARTDGQAGYLIFNNYQRYVENRDLDPSQVLVKLRDGTVVTIPEKPIVIPKDTAGIWPINLKLSDAVLRYATAQPICHLSNASEEIYFFFAHDGIQAEYAFNPTGIARINGKKQARAIVAKPGMDALLRIQTVTGKKITICTLTHAEALHLFRQRDVWGKTRVFLADADVLFDGKQIDLRSLGKASGTLSIFPAPAKLVVDGKILSSHKQGLFSVYEWMRPEREPSVTLVRRGVEKKEVLTKDLNWLCADRNSWAPLSCFRKQFELDRDSLTSARLVFRADDYLQLWVNKKFFGIVGTWNETTTIDLLPQLRNGKNVIACRLPNAMGPGGFVGKIVLTLQDGTKKICPVDTSWKSNTAEAPGWQDADFNDQEWKVPTIVGPFAGEQETGELTCYELTIPKGVLDGIYDLYLDFDWAGNILEAREDGKLIADWFYYGNHFRPSVRHWGCGEREKKIVISSYPITEKTPCYIEPRFRLDFSKQKSYSEIRKITAIPQYRCCFQHL